MTFVNARTTCPITAEKKEVIKTAIGHAIEILPGKSEAWLMVGFQDDYDLYFQGNNHEDSAFIEVKVYGHCEEAYYRDFTAKG